MCLAWFADSLMTLKRLSVTTQSQTSSQNVLWLQLNVNMQMRASLKLENCEFVAASPAIPLKYALYTPQNAFAYTGNEILMEKQQTPP